MRLDSKESPRTTLPKAYFWAVLERFGGLGVQFCTGLVLARILAPPDYGLIGMVFIFTTISGTIVNAGFSQALVQKRHVSAADETTAFYVSFALAGISIFLLWIAAPLISDFYKEPKLLQIIRISSLQVIPLALTLVQNARLTRQLDFQTTAMLSMLSGGVGGGIAIAMAMQGLGVWSLVAQTLISSTIQTGLLWWKVRWRPTAGPCWRSLRQMTRFSAGSLGSGLLSNICDNLYAVLTGRLYGAVDLGLLTRANQLQQLPVATVTSVVARVSFPSLCRLQDEPEKFVAQLSQTLRHTAAWHFPAMFGMAAVAPNLITALYTEKWSGSAPLLQILTFAGILYPINAIQVSSILALGKSGTILLLDAIKKPLLILALIGTAAHGVQAIAGAMVAYTVVCFIVNTVALSRVSKYDVKHLAGDLTFYGIVGLLSSLSAFAIGRILSWNAWIVLPLQIAVGIMTYGTAIYLGRATIFVEAWTTITKSFKACSRMIKTKPVQFVERN